MDLHFNKSRGDRIGGCDDLYVNDGYTSDVIGVCLNFTSFEYLVVKSILNSNNIALFCFVCRPPNTAVHLFLNELTDLLTWLQNCITNKNCIVVIMGDFNLNLLPIDTNSFVMSFIDNIYSALLFPTIHKPTHITKKKQEL